MEKVLKCEVATGLIHPDRVVSEVNNFTGALQERVNASDAVEWLLKQLHSSAPEVLKMSDNSGRRNCCGWWMLTFR